jgi:hypothetical protein
MRVIGPLSTRRMTHITLHRSWLATLLCLFKRERTNEILTLLHVTALRFWLIFWNIAGDYTNYPVLLIGQQMIFPVTWLAYFSFCTFWQLWVVYAGFLSLSTTTHRCPEPSGGYFTLNNTILLLVPSSSALPGGFLWHGPGYLYSRISISRLTTRPLFCFPF